MDVHGAIKKYESGRFKYGHLDCCLFVINIIRDMTDRDYAKQWRGRYNSEFGALRMIAEHGSLPALLSSTFGKIRPIWSVRNGNPVLIDPPLVERDSIACGLGICDGSNVVYLTENGITKAPVMMGRGCWHV